MKKIIFFVVSITLLVNCKNEGKLIDSEIKENEIEVTSSSSSHFRK